MRNKNTRKAIVERINMPTFPNTPPASVWVAKSINTSEVLVHHADKNVVLNSLNERGYKVTNMLNDWN